MECPLCNKTDIKRIIKKQGYFIWKCKKCKLFFVHPQPDIKTLKKIYSIEGGYSLSKKKLIKDNFSKELLERIEFLKDRKKKKILDVGCSVGDFLYIAEKKGLNAKGVELNKDLADIGLKEGLDIFIGELKDLKYKDSFDAINLGDIIEHVKEPKEFLKDCYRLLRKEGILIVSTPNSNSFFPKITLMIYYFLKIPWSHPTPPHHLFEFSDKNLSTLLNKEGFKIEKIKYKRINLKYSIYKIGHIDNIRKKMKEINIKNFLKALFKSNLKEISLFVLIFPIYGFAYFLDRIISVFNKKGNSMIIYARKK